MSTKALGTLALCAATVAAHAGVTYSNFSSSITFGNGDTDSLSSSELGTQNQLLTLTPTAGPLLVSNPGARQSATVTFQYDALSTSGINRLNQLLQGMTFGGGTITYSLSVTDLLGGGTLATVGPTVLSGNQAYNEETGVAFATSTTNYRVSGEIALDATAAGSAASVTLIEHNAVPEPATLLALGAGTLAFIRRRRRA